jgi:hypothetical protein
VCFSIAHGKGNVFAVRLTLTHGKGDEQPNGVNVHYEKNVCRGPQRKRTANYLFAVRQNKNARQTIFYRVFFLPCAVENAHGKAPLCYAPENMCTAKIEMHDNHRFPVVSSGSLGT